MSSPPVKTEPSDPSATPRGSSWPIIIGLGALTVVPLLVWEIPREKQRWKVAQAVQTRLDGNSVHSLELLDEVLEDQPDSVPVLLLRAQWQLNDGQGDRALADMQQALKLHPDDGELLLMHSQVLQALGMHNEAIQEIDAVLQRIGVASPKVRASFLNMAAYARAIGDVDLDRGLAQVDESLKQLPGEAAVLDTRGFILYRLERYEEALIDIEAACKDISASLSAWQKERQSYSRSGGDVEAESKKRYRNAAVIFYHRGLIHIALGNKTAADKDFAQVKAWGFEPEEELY